MADPDAKQPDRPVELAETVESQATPETLPSPRLRGDTAELPRGTAVGRYLIVARIGGGGMGVVYAAWDPKLERKVAIKLLRREAAGDPDHARSRLLREAQAMARLAHPNVAAVYDVGTFRDQVFIAMELVEGRTLSVWRALEPRSTEDILALFAQAGRALAAAHAVGIIHRDFKPDNVLVDVAGRVRVVDFGLARPVGADDGGPSNPELPILDLALTRTGAVLGTPAYMAPEQHQAKPTDPRTDQFSFAVALYEALYGERPFVGATLDEVAAATQNNQVREPPRKSSVPDWIRAVLLRALRASPDERYPDMESLVAALEDDPGRKRRRLLGRVAMVTGGVVMLGLTVHVSRQASFQVCRGAERKLAGIWDGPRRQAVRDAFARAGVPFGEAAFASVSRALDDYAARWTAMHSEACEATRLRGEQSEEVLDLRMECLGERLESLSEFSDLLVRADAKTIEKAVSAAQDMPALEDCANVALLRAPVRPPADPKTRAAVEALRHDLARGWALEHAGQFKPARELANRIAKEAEALHFRPLEAEALHFRGKAEHDFSDDDAAEATLRAALLAAEAGRHESEAAEAATLLVMIVGDHRSRPDEGMAFAARARAALEAVGGDERIEAYLLNAIGNVELHRGRYDEALAKYHQAVEIRKQIFGEDSQGVASVLDNIGLVHYKRGEYKEAIEYHRRALAVEERVLGPKHPLVALTLRNMAASLEGNSDDEEALAAFRRALAIDEATRPNSVAVAHSLAGMANALVDLGRFREALAPAERALAIDEKVLPPAHPTTAIALNELGNIHLNLGELDEAEPLIRRGVAMREKLLGPDHLDAALASHALLELLIRQERWSEAAKVGRHILAICEQKAPHHPIISYVLVALAQVDLAQKQPRDAVALLERSITLREALPKNAALLGESSFLLAQALWQLGQRDQAVQLARAAATHYAQAGATSQKERDEVRAWLETHDAQASAR